MASLLQIFGAGQRAGMYPMAGNTVYWFVTFDDDGSPTNLDSEQQKTHALSLVQGWKHGIAQCIESTEASRISRSRFFDRLAPASLAQRVGAGNVTLAGDALHPMTPNLGQVSCCTARPQPIVELVSGPAARYSFCTATRLLQA
jgi:2-polyprenyl-6-methoxyphenol hydroxylase-like FAD-dependent oxidoreductase